jgi:hypothetical protein
MRTRSSFFPLPPYAPQRNPDELLNNTLKHNVHREKIPTDQDELHANVLSFMRSVQKRPELVRSFFNAPLTQYAR